MPKKLDLVPKIVASFGVAVRKRVCACGGDAMQGDTTTQHGVYISNGRSRTYSGDLLLMKVE